MARKNVLDNNNPDTDEQLALSYDEAVKFIKASRNRTIFLRVQCFAPVADEEGKVFNLTSHVTVNVPTALKVLEDMFGRRFKTEAKVPLHVFKNSIFLS